jgi:hypothetical protein
MIHTYLSCFAGKIIIDFALCAAALSNDFDMLRLALQVKMRSHNQFSVFTYQRKYLRSWDVLVFSTKVKLG